MTPGDILITLRTCGDLRRGDVVTVSHTSPSGEYVYLDEQDGKISSRADAFMLAVKRPWHAWADPEWERRAREAAERFVREGIAVEATDPDPRDADAPSPPEAPRFRERCEHFGTEHAEEGGQCVRPALHDGPHRFEGAASAPETPASEGTDEDAINEIERLVLVYGRDRLEAREAGHLPGKAWDAKCRERDASLRRVMDAVRELARPASPASAPRETPADAALRDRILAHLDAANLTKARLIVEGLWPDRETRSRLRFCPGGPGHRSGVNALVEAEDCPACSAPPPESPASATSRGTDHDPATKEQS